MPVIPTTAYGTAEGVLNAARALVGDASRRNVELEGGALMPVIPFSKPQEET